ncbi:MAG: GNAT family N-acetyltransferase [Betaproteobacteria bacterium]
MEAVAGEIVIRALTSDDLAAVVAIDAAIEGRPRRAYVLRRLAAAVREPTLHAQLAATDGSGFAGYVLARVLEGEFGRSERGLRLELVGVRPDALGHGVGKRLLEAIVEWARRHGVRELRTAAAWDHHRMLRWFDAMGFRLAPERIVDCAVEGGAYRPERDDALALPVGQGPGHEIDFGAPEGNDFERLARDTADVRSMTAGDLAEIARIDRGITGRDRRDYIAHKLGEAMDDSAIRVSLTARMDGAIVGYLMARADLGDFGRTEPVAVIDTIGVDPGYAHRGVAHALMSQLFANLGALRIERVETVVGPRDLALTSFLYDVGFAPAQRLAFVRRI